MWIEKKRISRTSLTRKADSKASPKEDEAKKRESQEKPETKQDDGTSEETYDREKTAYEPVIAEAGQDTNASQENGDGSNSAVQEKTAEFADKGSPQKPVSQTVKEDKTVATDNDNEATEVAQTNGDSQAVKPAVPQSEDTSHVQPSGGENSDQKHAAVKLDSAQVNSKAVANHEEKETVQTTQTQEPTY